MTKFKAHKDQNKYDDDNSEYNLRESDNSFEDNFSTDEDRCLHS